MGVNLRFRIVAYSDYVWIAALMHAWDAERTDQQRETLGKLGGG